MSFHVAAYSIHPSAAAFDERREAAFLQGLRALPFIAGIELPHLHGFDRWNEEFFFRHADPAWTYLATALPALSAALRANPDIGLSAASADSRLAAVADAMRLRDDLHRTHDRLGRRAIRAVELHSGCSGGRLSGRAGPDHLAASLVEIGSWNWDGAELLLEHCDAAVPGQPFQKGFLTVDEEIAALRTANACLGSPVAAVVNWGRSAIEGRSAAAPLLHAAQLRAAGLLRGLFLSGCSATEAEYGAWQDTHMPPAPLAPGSLLDATAMREFLAQEHGTTPAFTGIKVAIRPNDASVEARLALLRATAEMAAMAVAGA